MHLPLQKYFYNALPNAVDGLGREGRGPLRVGRAPGGGGARPAGGGARRAPGSACSNKNCVREC